MPQHSSTLLQQSLKPFLLFWRMQKGGTLVLNTYIKLHVRSNRHVTETIIMGCIAEHADCQFKYKCNIMNLPSSFLGFKSDCLGKSGQNMKT